MLWILETVWMAWKIHISIPIPILSWPLTDSKSDSDFLKLWLRMNIGMDCSLISVLVYIWALNDYINALPWVTCGHDISFIVLKDPSDLLPVVIYLCFGYSINLYLEIYFFLLIQYKSLLRDGWCFEHQRTVFWRQRPYQSFHLDNLKLRRYPVT